MRELRLLPQYHAPTLRKDLGLRRVSVDEMDLECLVSQLEVRLMGVGGGGGGVVGGVGELGGGGGGGGGRLSLGRGVWIEFGEPEEERVGG